MTTTSDIGTRIELVPMDGHFHDVSLALYRQPTPAGPTFRVHTYSGLPGVDGRVARVRDALTTLADLQPTEGDALRFACGHEHNLAVRRAFLEACKHDPETALDPPPTTITDRKSGLTMAVESLGQGQYRVVPGGDDPEGLAPRRVGVLVNGLLKLGQMRRVEGADGVTDDCVAFECGSDHDALVHLLLQRAPNVRALVREQEAMAARGVLSAPGAQDPGTP
jgi:hypothetical protein